MYGPLCCDWIVSSDGAKTCSQTISAGNVCTCSGNAPVQSVPVPIPAPVPEPKPSNSEKKKKDDDFFWEPMPDMPGWLPFNPIDVPKDGTPCKKHCDNACGWSQSNGDALCCDPNPKTGACGQAQINGKCYCS